MKPRLGFLGVGWIGRHRMERILESGAAEAAMLWDPSAERLAEARASAPEARVAESYEELLDSDLDGIVIATPSALHAEQSMRALQAGKAVFCQKPLGRTAPETLEVVRTAQRWDRLLGVDLSYRHTAGMQKIRSLISEGDIGELFAVDLVFHNAYGPDKPWFYDPKLSGGGCVMDLGVHLVDLALWIQGFPRIEAATSRLFAGGKPLTDTADARVEDYAVARLDLAQGATIQLSCSWRLSAGQDCIIGAHFHGTKGGLSLKNVNGSFYDFAVERYRGTAREQLLSPPDAWGGRAAIDWARKLASGSRFEPESWQLVTVAQALDAIYGRRDAEASTRISAI